MTVDQLRRVEETYFRVRELAPDARAETLGAEPDARVRAEVESLLGAVPAEFLATPVLGEGLVSEMAAGEPDPLVGARIGPYRAERLLGSGGMGSVYLASRADGAFEQQVAIKVVKRGMDTDELLSRFRIERRTLANLRHPNIASLLDGGSLADGRPYLVMEFVEGRPIALFCKERALTTAARLRLFMSVCSAVQFAHQNLVVHRDLKPGNILVTDGGTPKLLDFGIAKVMDSGPAITVTGLEQRRLTPEYASPEQVEGRPVTTASDVYSLGVILYELLTGHAPYQFETRSTSEILRIVTTVSPTPPSAAVLAPGGSRADAPSARIRRELRGDADNIVLMALRKEPERRYTSAEQFAADIDRFLRGMPVIARADTLAYRTAKFLSRNAIGSAAAAAGLLLAVAGVAAIVWQNGAARHQRDQAFIARDQAEATAKFLKEALASANPMRPGGAADIRQVLDEAASRIGAELRDQPLVQASLRSTIGAAYLSLGDYDKAERHIRIAYEQRLTRLGARAHDTAESMIDLASVLYARQRLPEAERLLLDALSIFREIRGRENPDIARVQNDLGAVLSAQGRTEEAARALEEAVRIREADPRSLDLAESLNNYAGVLRARDRLAEAEDTMRRALEIRTESLGPEHALVAQSIANLAVIVHARGDLPRAEPLYRRAAELERAALGADHPDRAPTLSSLGVLLRATGDAGAAEPLFREALRVRLGALPPSDPRTMNTRVGLLEVLNDLRRDDEARDLLRDILRALESPGFSPELRQQWLTRAAASYDARGDSARAAELRDQAEAAANNPLPAKSSQL